MFHQHATSVIKLVEPEKNDAYAKFCVFLVTADKTDNCREA